MAKSSSVEPGFSDAISNSFHQDGDLELLPIGIDHAKLYMAKKEIRSQLSTCLHEDKLTDPLVLQSTEEGLEVNQLSTFSNNAVNICWSPRINDAPTEPGSSLFVEISHEVQHDTPVSSQDAQSTILTMDYCSQNEIAQSNQMQAEQPSEADAARLPFNSSSFNDDHHVAISCETSSHSLKGMIQNDRQEAAEKKHDLQHQRHIKSDNGGPEVLFGVSHHSTEKTDRVTHEYVPSTDMQSCMGQMTGEISTVGKSNYKRVFVSKRRPVTTEEKERAFQMARAFKSKNPFFTVVMKPTHVYRGFYMTIPTSFAKVYLSKKQRDFILEASQSWHVRCIYRKNYVALSKGWSTFVWGNNLEEGDVCILELVNSSKFTFKVHICRVVEEFVPLCRSCEQET